jgi:hypothetical protein
MDAKQYKEYEESVRAFFERTGVQNLSSLPEEDENYSEPFFSWRPCDCCGTHLGGTRENANGYNPTTKEVLDLIVCEDCIYYAEYGRLDDMTMMDIRRSEDSE